MAKRRSTFCNLENEVKSSFARGAAVSVNRSKIRQLTKRIGKVKRNGRKTECTILNQCPYLARHCSTPSQSQRVQWLNRVICSLMASLIAFLATAFCAGLGKPLPPDLVSLVMQMLAQALYEGLVSK